MVGSPNVDRGSRTQVIEMAIYPCLRSFPPQRAELTKERAISIEFACGPKPTHNVVGANRMDEHALCVALIQFPIVDQFCHESDRSHLAHKRGIEADLVDAVHDFEGTRRLVWSLDRIDVYDEDISRLARIDQRKQRRVSHIAAIPIVLAINLNGLIKERQTGRCKHTICSNLLIGEDLDLSSAHIGRGQEQLDCRALPQPLEIDELSDEVVQRIVVEWIKLIGRQESRYDLEQLQRARRGTN